MRSFLLATSVALLLPVAAFAQQRHVEVTSSRATIREADDSGSRLVTRPDLHDLFDLARNDRTANNWYEIRLPADGRQGFIYANFVRVHAGPAELAGTPQGNPLLEHAQGLTPGLLRAAARHLAVGKPQAVYEIVREGYVTAYDTRLKIPRWVMFTLRPGDLDGPAQRTDRWQPETAAPPQGRSEDQDYEGARYTLDVAGTATTYVLARGHMAPAEAMDRSDQVMAESFILSNAAPQIGGQFNGSKWRTLEDRVRDWVRLRGPLTVIAGPIFEVAADTDRTGSVSYRLIGENRVAVPTAFFKIVVDMNDPANPQVLPFRFPHRDVTGNQNPLTNFLTSVRAIEQETGLDFLTALDEATERALEAATPTTLWPVH